MTLLRVGVPSDLEAALLVWGLGRPPLSRRLILQIATHTRLGELLDAGELDLALLSTAELARRSSALEIVPGVAIGTQGAAPLARLDYRGALGDVRRVVGEATGHAAETLVTLLFRQAGRSVELVPPQPSHRSDDAFLRIGDAARASAGPADGSVWRSVNLAEAWTTLTAKPFIWDVWAARPGMMTRSIYGALHDARVRAKRHLKDIVDEEALRRGMRAETIESEVVCDLKFRLGREQLAGLEEFWSLSNRGELLPERALNFVPLAAGTGCASAAARRRVTR